MAANESGHRGSVKDPEQDGRLKENREAGRTKGTTPGSDARAHEHGNEPAQSSHSRSQGSGESKGSTHKGSGSHSSGERSSGTQGSQSQSAGGDDLKSREYKDEKGEVHHHTRTYQEQHKKD